MEQSAEIDTKLVCISLEVIRSLSEAEQESSAQLPTIINQLLENGCNVCIFSSSNRLSDFSKNALRNFNIDADNCYLNFSRNWNYSYQDMAASEHAEIENMYVINYDDMEEKAVKEAGAKSLIHRNIAITANWLRKYCLDK